MTCPAKMATSDVGIDAEEAQSLMNVRRRYVVLDAVVKRKVTHFSRMVIVEFAELVI